MNIVHLKYAVEIARTKSISKAAENLYMGQPNLSRAIKELEESLGITIFERTSKGISVTPDGEEFLQYARRIISQVDEVENMYKNARTHKQRFSVSVPRASYISDAFTEFAKNIDVDSPAEIYYEETNSMRAIENVVKENYNLGIVRYQASFDKYYKAMFEEKKLDAQLIAEFTYVLAMSKDSPLASKEEIYYEDLAKYIEIAHSDPYVPSVSHIDVKKAEMSKFVDKHIYVFERGSQFGLLENVTNTFMWVSPLPEDLLEKFNLVQRKCVSNTKEYKDVLIKRRGYKLSKLDNIFITEVSKAKRKYLSPSSSL